MGWRLAAGWPFSFLPVELILMDIGLGGGRPRAWSTYTQSADETRDLGMNPILAQAITTSIHADQGISGYNRTDRLALVLVVVVVVGLRSST